MSTGERSRRRLRPRRAEDERIRGERISVSSRRRFSADAEVSSAGPTSSGPLRKCACFATVQAAWPLRLPWQVNQDLLTGSAT